MFRVSLKKIIIIINNNISTRKNLILITLSSLSFPNSPINQSRKPLINSPLLNIAINIVAGARFASRAAVGRVSQRLIHHPTIYVPAKSRCALLLPICRNQHCTRAAGKLVPRRYQATRIVYVDYLASLRGLEVFRSCLTPSMNY